MPLVSSSSGTWDPLVSAVRSANKTTKIAGRRGSAIKSYTPQFKAGAGGRAPKGYSSQAYYGNSRLPGHGVSGFPSTGMDGSFGSQWRLISDDLTRKMDENFAKNFAKHNHQPKVENSFGHQNHDNGPFGGKEFVAPFGMTATEDKMDTHDPWQQVAEMNKMSKHTVKGHIAKAEEAMGKMDLSNEVAIDMKSLPHDGPRSHHKPQQEDKAPNADFRLTHQWRGKAVAPGSNHAYSEHSARTKPPMATHYPGGVVGNVHAGTTGNHGGGGAALLNTTSTRPETTGSVGYEVDMANFTIYDPPAMGYNKRGGGADGYRSVKPATASTLDNNGMDSSES